MAGDPSRPNLYEGELPLVMEAFGIRGRALARPAGARELGATLYELEPGASGFNLHAHYGNEELFFVLAGTPTLRTGDGERELALGEVVACPRGIGGLHTICNRSQEEATVLAVSTANSPDVAVYPEQGNVGVATRHPFEPVPEGGDEGVLGLFSAAENKRPARR